MQKQSQCQKCNSENIYQDGNMWICPACSHEWSAFLHLEKDDTPKTDDSSVRDAYGNMLADGDAVTVIKELKVKGSSAAVKVGTKVKNIRVVDGADGHNISCKIEGIGAMNLKSEFVKKA